MGFAVAEKGLLWLDIEARSPGGHASRALRGETAVMKLAGLLARIDAMNDMYATVPPELAGVTGGEGNLGLRVSLNAGTIAAGTVRSQVATRARAQLDLRLPPGITAKTCEDLIRAQCAGDPDISIAVVKAWDANWTALDNPIVVELAAAAAAVRGERPAFVVRLPGQRRAALARPRRAGRLLRPAADALGRRRRLCQRAGRRRLRQDLCAHRAGADGAVNASLLCPCSKATTPAALRLRAQTLSAWISVAFYFRNARCQVLLLSSAVAAYIVACTIAPAHALPRAWS